MTRFYYALKPLDGFTVGARVVGPHGRTSGFESSELTIQRGLALLRNYQHPLNLPDNVISVAERHFKLAHEFKFTKGRHIEHVIAVCLYMGCKYQKTSHMLIDFADILRVRDGLLFLLQLLTCC